MEADNEGECDNDLEADIEGVILLVSVRGFVAEEVLEGDEVTLKDAVQVAEKVTDDESDSLRDSVPDDQMLAVGVTEDVEVWESECDAVSVSDGVAVAVGEMVVDTVADVERDVEIVADREGETLSDSLNVIESVRVRLNDVDSVTVHDREVDADHDGEGEGEGVVVGLGERVPVREFVGVGDLDEVTLRLSLRENDKDHDSDALCDSDRVVVAVTLRLFPSTCKKPTRTSLASSTASSKRKRIGLLTMKVTPKR